METSSICKGQILVSTINIKLVSTIYEALLLGVTNTTTNNIFSFALVNLLATEKEPEIFNIICCAQSGSVSKKGMKCSWVTKRDPRKLPEGDHVSVDS